MQSGQMRWLANYNIVLTLGVSPQGLYLASMFLFRFMQPPLLVPWSEIKVRRKKGWVFEYVILTMGHKLAIPLLIRAKLAAKLREVPHPPHGLPGDDAPRGDASFRADTFARLARAGKE
jgi:hypothetical protein